MPTTHTHATPWWEPLGLSAGGVAPRSGGATAAVRAVLIAHPPVGFEHPTGEAELTRAQLVELLREAAADAERRARDAAAAAVAERGRLGWELVERALAAPGADEPILAGRWAGIARGEAVAWCWNLFQFEPRGIAHPGSQVRHEAIAQLREGDVPAVFGYPERARELRALGLTPRSYRQHREALGERPAPTRLA